MADESTPKFTPEERAELAKFEQEFGAIAPFRLGPGKLIVFRRPTQPEWAKFDGTPRSAPPGRFDIYVHEHDFVIAMCCKGDARSTLNKRPGLQGLFLEGIRGIASNGGEGEDIEFLGKDWKRPEATT